jgi:hypothetical protein
VTWPLVGEVHLPTAAFFDLGVFAVVVGSTLLLLTAIAHQSLRALPPQRRHAHAGRGGAPEAADGSGDLDRDRRDGQCRGVAGAAAADLPGADRPVAAVVRGQPVHLQRRQPVGGREPIVKARRGGRPRNYTDPLPQALVLTAIVIGFATTALFLVVLLALRGLSGSDHVDGREERAMSGQRGEHLLVAPVLLPLGTAALMLLLGEGRRRTKAMLNLLSTAIGPGDRRRAAARAWRIRWRRRRSASTCRATGRCPSASCWWPTGCRR